MINSKTKEIVEVIKNSKNILVVVDERLDFDAFSSALIIKYFLEEKFKITPSITYIKEIEKGFRQTFEKFDSLDCVKENLDPNDIDYTKYDLVITTDTGNINKGSYKTQDFSFPKNLNVINFDHHSNNTYFGTYNFVIEEGSMAMVLYKYFSEINFVPTDKIKNLMLLSYITDTGIFKYDKVSTEGLRMVASYLDDLKRELYYYTEKLEYGSSLANIKFDQIAYKNFKYVEDLKIGYTTLTIDDMEKAGLDPENYKQEYNPVENFRKAQDIRMVFSVKESISKDTKEIKYVASLRSKEGLDVATIAQKYFKGGGHVYAAGAAIRNVKNIDEAVQKVIDALYKELK